MQARSLGWKDLLEEEMATHSSILTWRIPWTEEPGGLQSVGSHRGGHDWACAWQQICWRELSFPHWVVSAPLSKITWPHMWRWKPNPFGKRGHSPNVPACHPHGPAVALSPGTVGSEVQEDGPLWSHLHSQDRYDQLQSPLLTQCLQ